MMPLTLANIGEENLIHRVGGNAEVKKHLEDLGFVAGGTVTVVAALGGSVGSLLGMYTVRHKTKHLKFTLGIPLILVAQCLLAVLLLAYGGK